MKVFCTGMQRTGTTSLANALRALGLATRDNPVELLDDPHHQVLQEFDAFTDNPVPLLYRELDRIMPGSRFIHTIRDEALWLKSVEWLFTVGAVKFAWHKNPAFHESHRRIYGTTTFDVATFREAYRRHNADVAAYFADRPGDLLEFDVTRGDDYRQLAPFLGLPIPTTAFPHQNKRQGRLRVALRHLRGRLLR